MVEGAGTLLGEVRDPVGRLDDVGHPKVIACALRSDLTHLIEAMPECHWVEMPLDLGHDFKVPELPDLDISFLNKPIGPDLKTRIEGRRDDLAAALCVYEWVMDLKPDLVLVWTDAVPNKRAMVMAGNDLHIPTVEIKHGQMHEYLWGHFEAKQIAQWILATYEYREFHRFYGMDGTVIPTGSPRFDRLHKIDHTGLRAAAREDLRFKDQDLVITYLGRWVPQRSAWHDGGLYTQGFLDFVGAYQQLKALIPNLQLVFKQHPSDKAELKQWRADFNSLGIIKDLTVMDDPLEIAIGAADLVVGARSSAMIEAMIMGIPCIALDWRPTVDDWQFTNRGILMIRDKDQILHAMFDLLMDEDSRLEVLQGIPAGLKHFGCVGDATNRVVRALRRLLSGRTPDEGCWA